MVISEEVKFPRPPRIETGESRLTPREITGIDPVLPIRYITRKWRRGERLPFGEESMDGLSNEAEKDLHLLVHRVNADLEKANVPIHLGLVREERGYALDIYDCTDGLACRIVRAEAIHIRDLPAMLKNLQQEAGLLIDIQV